jgi:signal peptidase II
VGEFVLSRSTLRIAAFVVALVTLDQLTKLWALTTLTGGKSYPFLGGTFFGETVFLTLRANRGGAGGIGAHQPGMAFSLGIGALLLCLAIVLGYRLYARWHNPGPFAGVFLVGSLAPLLANGLDRLRLGYVVDFVGINGFAVFNLADMLVSVAVVGLVVESRAFLLRSVRRQPVRKVLAMSSTVSNA